LSSSIAEPKFTLAHAKFDPLPFVRSKAGGATIADRLRTICNGKTPQTLARLTGAKADAVRRYLRGAAVPPMFLVCLAHAYGISLNWLLNGRGPRHRVEVYEVSIERASSAELLAELARRINESGAGSRSQKPQRAQTISARIGNHGRSFTNAPINGNSHRNTSSAAHTTLAAI